jgi:hypothetical protein
MRAPVALKAEGSRIAHRSEVGAVRTGLSTASSVRRAYRDVAAVCARHGDDVVVQAMARPGLELLVSAVRDPEVGPCIVLRPGGLLVEAVDRTLVLTGHNRRWTHLLRHHLIGDLLAGWRGGPAHDVAALVSVATALRDAVVRAGVVAIECNPVIVHPSPQGGATIVDMATF